MLIFLIQSLVFIVGLKHAMQYDGNCKLSSEALFIILDAHILTGFFKKYKMDKMMYEL